jgi:hypothetical protein
MVAYALLYLAAGPVASALFVSTLLLRGSGGE